MHACLLVFLLALLALLAWLAWLAWLDLLATTTATAIQLFGVHALASFMLFLGNDNLFNEIRRALWATSVLDSVKR